MYFTNILNILTEKVKKYVSTLFISHFSSNNGNIRVKSKENSEVFPFIRRAFAWITIF